MTFNQPPRTRHLVPLRKSEPSYMRYGIRQIPLLPASLLALGCAAISACDAKSSLDDGSLKFAGVSHVELTADGSYLLRWNEAQGADSQIVYNVYMANYEIAEVVSNGTAIELASSSRKAFITENNQELAPHKAGQLLNRSDRGTNSVAINMLLDSSYTYGFQVVATDSKGAIAGSDKILYLASQNNESQNGGCTSAVAVNQSSAKVFFDFPAGAKDVSVFRDGVLLERVQSPTQRVVIDENITPGIEYVYECRTTFGSEIIRGKSFKVQTINPLIGYQGCDNATFDDDGNVKVSYIHTDREVRIAIYRDSILIHEGTSPSKPYFIDYTAIPGETHTYSCVAEAATLSQEGSRKLKVKIPDLFGTFQGCFRATALGASQVKVEFFYPDGAKALSCDARWFAYFFNR